MCETLEEARLMAAVGARAQRLFEDGYSAVWKDTVHVSILSPQSAEYEIDTANETCTCPFFTAWNGQRPCKHLLGYQCLLAKQAEQKAFAHSKEAFVQLTQGQQHKQPTQ